MGKITHFMYCPFTGLGLYNGHRGKRWLKNRIYIFKETVLKSLLAQTEKDFVLWVSWRYEDKDDKIVQEFKEFLDNTGLKVVFTYSGVCFWDDKYPDDVARERLISAIHDSMGELYNFVGDSETVLMTIQPSDDCYYNEMIEETKRQFKFHPKLQVYGYKTGYVMDYLTGRMKEWNPKTTPPFYTIKFSREVFTDPLKHLEYTGPYKSHEYVKDYLVSEYDEDTKGFIVGTHSENISTVFDHPYAKDLPENFYSAWYLESFGLSGFESIKLKNTLRGKILNKLPYKVKRKLRYLSGEKKWLLRPLFSLVYNFMRS